MYEFDCPACKESFEELVRNAEAVKDVTCPHCGNRKVKKKLSAFSARVSGGSKTVSAAECAPGGT
jgi:putative FmdB family regulatory protein